MLVDEQEEYIGDVLTVFKGMDTFSHDEWILDSGCHVDIYSRKEYFDMFQEKNMYFVFLGDGSTYDITNVGIGKIKMFDGVVCTLGGVAYVPKMQKKITRGCLVLMKGEKYGDGLYCLMGNIIINDVPLTSTGS